MKKISKSEVLAILAATGVSSSSLAMATSLDPQNSNSSLGKVEHSGPTYLGDESKCGKGSCGKDEKGAAAAKEKKEEKKVKAKKEVKEKKAEKKSEKKEEKKEEPQAN